MSTVVKGRHMDVTPALREYAEEKIGKVAKLLNDHMVTSVEIELSAERNPAIEKKHVAEVTMHTKGHVIRAKEAATDMYAAIDLVSEKLERQVQKLRTKLQNRHKGAAPVAAEPEPAEEREPSIVKRKVIEVKPMAPEEAALQMELLGHDFFVFASAESETINVLYRRSDGDYGLIIPR
ncbi:MAG: ribosome-associated translation inhibitor RaiA [Coriobacteriia bacterium]|nr:ribosome-associated translation inhibitor RaiA [Coriobacteriia bacterium]